MIERKDWKIVKRVKAVIEKEGQEIDSALGVVKRNPNPANGDVYEVTEFDKSLNVDATSTLRIEDVNE